MLYWIYKRDQAEYLELLLDLKPGDLLEIDRKVYKHWAVFVGDGEVIHKVDPEESDDESNAGSSSICRHALKVYTSTWYMAIIYRSDL